VSKMESDFSLVAGAQIGRVTDVLASGTVLVSLNSSNQLVSCALLHPIGGRSMAPARGSSVIVLLDTTNDVGIVLGAVEPSTAEAPSAAIMDELVLEAKHSLTLRVGAGSITIREDGKILIKGKDLVSHAQRLNRIKGGAVQIN